MGKSSKSQPVAPARQRATIVIADANLEDARATRMAIESAGPHLWTREVGSGKKLISYLQGKGKFSDRVDFPYPNLIFLDLKIRAMEGLSLLCWLMNNPPHNLIPVVALCRSKERRLANAAYTLGARDFLVKPLKGGAFKRILASLGNTPNGLRLREIPAGAAASTEAVPPPCRAVYAPGPTKKETCLARAS
jgi:CheY-like chemotaxis protein